MDSYRFSRVAGRWFSKSTKLLGGLPAANERSDWAVAHQRAKRPIVSYRNRYAALCCQSDLCLDQAHVSLSTLLVIWRSPQDWQHVLRYVPSFWKLALLPVRTFFFFSRDAILSRKLLQASIVNHCDLECVALQVKDLADLALQTKNSSRPSHEMVRWTSTWKPVQ